MRAALALQAHEQLWPRIGERLEEPRREEVLQARAAGAVSACEGDGSSGRAYFELMRYAYRDPSLRRRIAALNQWHVATSLAIIVGGRADSAEIARSAQAIAHLVFAAVDGIELHYDMDPAGYPLDEVFELLLCFRRARPGG